MDSFSGQRARNFILSLKQLSRLTQLLCRRPTGTNLIHKPTLAVNFPIARHSTSIVTCQFRW